MDGVLLGLGLMVIIAYLWYVSLVKKRNICGEALSGINLQLNKRVNTARNVVALAGEYTLAEPSLLSEITALVAQVSDSYNPLDTSEVRLHLAAADSLNNKMGHLMVMVENSAELNSDNPILQAIQGYNEVEVVLRDARRFYNTAVIELNSAVGAFPGSIIASMAKIKLMPVYEKDNTDRTTSKAVDHLNSLL